MSVQIFFTMRSISQRILSRSWAPHTEKGNCAVTLRYPGTGRTLRIPLIIMEYLILFMLEIIVFILSISARSILHERLPGLSSILRKISPPLSSPNVACAILPQPLPTPSRYISRNTSSHLQHHLDSFSTNPSSLMMHLEK